jgi:D-alanyl-D-alanine carboxypeptidase (penicillin-binding protein 5/6)
MWTTPEAPAARPLEGEPLAARRSRVRGDRLILVAMACLHLGSASAAPADRFPRAAASYLVAVDGEVRWARDADVRRPVASLAKLLAALVLVEARDWQPQAEVSVSAAAAGIDGTRLGLKRSERVAAGDLLGAMLVASANDACRALVEHAAGSAATFAARMNARAATLGMTASHFVDPCGLDRPNQGATAMDLLRLSRAVRNDARVVVWPPRTGGSLQTRGGRRIDYRSSNLLLGRLAGATGLKTGTTRGAGHCLIATAQRGGREVVVVLLDAADRWNHAAVLIEEALREP